MENHVETPGKIVIDENTIYEVDLECVRCKREKETCQAEKEAKEAISEKP